MKTITLILLSLAFSSFASAEETDLVAVQSCLKKFGTHPFNAENPVFDTLAAKVKVLGIGGTTSDMNITKEPKLVLIKPNVTVLSKSNLYLLNPNGWYCLKGQVAVLGKSVITLHCDGKITSSSDEVTVLGGGDNGVTVLGATRIVRNDCPKPDVKK